MEHMTNIWTSLWLKMCWIHTYLVENEKDIPLLSFSVHSLLLEAPSPSFWDPTFKKQPNCLYSVSASQRLIRSSRQYRIHKIPWNHQEESQLLHHDYNRQVQEKVVLTLNLLREHVQDSAYHMKFRTTEINYEGDPKKIISKDKII